LQQFAELGCLPRMQRDGAADDDQVVAAVQPAITTSGWVIGPRTPPMITSRVSRCLIF
jgi:hypothetical protein